MFLKPLVGVLVLLAGGVLPVQAATECPLDTTLSCPLTRCFITSPYGNRVHPRSQRERMHRGLDIRAKVGTELVAPVDGFILGSGYDRGGWGRYLAMRISGQPHVILFAHLSEVVIPYGPVKQGEAIARTGKSGGGRWMTEHLHVEIWIDGNHKRTGDFSSCLKEA